MQSLRLIIQLYNITDKRLTMHLLSKKANYERIQVILCVYKLYKYEWFHFDQNKDGQVLTGPHPIPMEAMEMCPTIRLSTVPRDPGLFRGIPEVAVAVTEQGVQQEVYSEMCGKQGRRKQRGQIHNKWRSSGKKKLVKKCER